VAVSFVEEGKVKKGDDPSRRVVKRHKRRDKKEGHRRMGYRKEGGGRGSHFKDGASLSSSSSSISSSSSSKRPLSHLTLAGISLVWLARTAFQTALTIYFIPLQVRKMVGEEQKGRTLGLIGVGGSFVTVIACPLFGMISDKWSPSLQSSRLLRYLFSVCGRRIPFVLLGTICGLLPTLAMCLLDSPSNIYQYALAFCFVGFFDSLASAPYSALIPDIVDPSQYGSARCVILLLLFSDHPSPLLLSCSLVPIFSFSVDGWG
jgi:MFS family permease